MEQQTMDQWQRLLGEEEGLGNPLGLVCNQVIKQLYVGSGQDDHFSVYKLLGFFISDTVHNERTRDNIWDIIS